MDWLKLQVGLIFLHWDKIGQVGFEKIYGPFSLKNVLPRVRETATKVTAFF